MKYKVTYTIPNNEGRPSMVFAKMLDTKEEAEGLVNTLRTVGVQIKTVGGATASGIVTDVMVESVQ